MFSCNTVTPFWFSYMCLLENLYKLRKRGITFLLSAGMENIRCFFPHITGKLATDSDSRSYLTLVSQATGEVSKDWGCQHSTDSAIPGPRGLHCDSLQGDEKIVPPPQILWQGQRPTRSTAPSRHVCQCHCISQDCWRSLFRVLGNFSPGVRAATSDISRDTHSFQFLLNPYLAF